MTLRRRDFLQLAAGAAALPATFGSARAQSYPARPVTMVVPVPAGGALDTVARIIAEGMRPTLGQPLIIENVTGASGTIGVNRVAKSAPDGHMIIYGAFATHVVSAAVYDLPYDPIGDFEPVGLISRTPWLIATKNALPVTDLKGLIAWLKANSDKASLGSAGPGSPSHIAGILFQQVTGTNFQFVPYRGTAPAMQDLVSGQIDLSIVDPIVCLPQFRAGRVKVHAVMAKSRTAMAPDIPTVDEAGAPGAHIAPWHAIWAPKGTPKPIVAKLNEAVVNALADPTVRQKLSEQSFELGTRDEQTPEYLATFHKAELERWRPIIKAAGIKPG
jgi:tripartite-type tricarboxylate transporter receptor subunit TctC